MPLELNEDENGNPLHFPAQRLAAAMPGWETIGSGGPSPELLKKFDELTVVDWLRKTDASAAVIGLFIAANSGRSRENGTLAEGVPEILEEDIKRFAAIKGGNDLLPRAMADELGKWVGRILLDDDRVKVVARHVDEEEGQYFYEADQLVGALPAPITACSGISAWTRMRRASASCLRRPAIRARGCGIPRFFPRSRGA